MTTWNERSNIVSTRTERDLNEFWYYIDENSNFYIDENWDNYVFLFNSFSTNWTERPIP